MDRIFEGKVALVTGSTFGIGKATAIAFAKRGAKLVLSDVIDDEFTAGSTGDEVQKAGSDAIFVKCDVSDTAQVQALIDKTIETYGRLDFAFNNAGVEGGSMPLPHSTEENWHRVIGINLTGVFYCMKAQIPVMQQQGSGVIVNNASVAGLVGFQGAPAYVASKHGVVGLTKNAALDLAQQGIRVNAVCPGVIDTPMIDRATEDNPDLRPMLEAGEPIGRLGRPEEIAETVVFLCTDGAGFITGQAIAVDGGWTTQ